MKTALVIGGSKGIGLAISKKLKARGDSVIVLSRTIGNWDGEFSSVDLLNLDNIETVINNFIDEKIKFDYIIFSQKNRSNPHNLDDEISLTIKSSKLIIQKLIPNNMNEQSAVVFISSPAAKYILKEQPVEYHISKAALEQMAKYYALYLGKFGITFNSIAPGTVLKDSNQDFYSSHQEASDKIIRVTPLKRMGTAEDVANLAAFLCSENASFITGQTIFIDGGQSIEGSESLSKNF